MEYTYLFLNLGSLIVPFIFSFHPKLLFYKEWKSFFPALIIVALFFIIWDIYFTSIGVWGFNEQYLTGVYIFNLPLEEVLFFICIPYASVFTYHCFKIFITHENQKLSRYISTTILIISTLLLIINFGKWYTTTTLLFLIPLLILIIKSNPKWLIIFYASFFVILIPFFIVNGALTGMFFEVPVVWYNDLENMNVRLISIPLEDSFYALLMLLSTTLIFEKIKTIKTKV